MTTKFSEIPILSLDKQIEKEVNIFLEGCEQATIFHTVAWYRILQKAFTQKGEEYRIILAQDGEKVVGYYPFLLNKRLILFSNLYSPPSKYETPYGGPLHNGSSEVFEGLIKKSEELVFRKYHVSNSPQNQNSGFLDLGYEITNSETVILDLNSDVDYIWKNFSRNTKRNIKKAENNDLRLICIDNPNEENISSYHNFVSSNLQDRSVDIKPKHFYSLILETLIPLNLARFVLINHGKKFIGGAIFLIFRDTVYFWHVGILPEYQKYSPNFLLLWDALIWSKDNGYKKFDFVVIDKEKLPGIARFKTSWGGALYNFSSFYKNYDILKHFKLNK